MVAWQEVRHAEQRAAVGGRVLYVTGGSPSWWCYSDGDYLGTELKLESARARCVRGEKGRYVMELETVDEALSRVPKAKQLKLKWAESGRDEVTAIVEGEKLPARIRTLDKKTYAAYRDGKYLGSEASLDNAKKRCIVNEISQKNSVMRLWEQEHPGELPPGLQLTKEERDEYWRLNPHRATPAPRVGRGAAPRQGEDAATGKLRAELAADGGAGKRTKGKVRAEAADVPQGVLRVKAGAAIPKKPGSSAHGRWSVLWAHDGKTVAAYAKAGGNMTTLANAMEKGLVSVETPSA